MMISQPFYLLQVIQIIYLVMFYLLKFVCANAAMLIHRTWPRERSNEQFCERRFEHRRHSVSYVCRTDGGPVDDGPVVSRRRDQ